MEAVYAAVFIDAISDMNVKVRDGQVRNRPIYAAIGVDLAGHKDILGMWAGDGDGRIIRVREVLVRGPNRPEGPRRQGRVLRGLRRAEGPA